MSRTHGSKSAQNLTVFPLLTGNSWTLNIFVHIFIHCTCTFSAFSVQIFLTESKPVLKKIIIRKFLDTTWTLFYISAKKFYNLLFGSLFYHFIFPTHQWVDLKGPCRKNYFSTVNWPCLDEFNNTLVDSKSPSIGLLHAKRCS